MDHFSEEIYNYLYGQLISRMAYYLVLGIVVVFGPFLGMLMVLFERFGADSQKRTIINRLCSFVFINISIMSFTWSTLRILRDNFGLLTSKLFDPLAIIYQSPLVKQGGLGGRQAFQLLESLYII